MEAVDRWHGYFTDYSDVVCVFLALLSGGVAYLQNLDRPPGVWDEPTYANAAYLAASNGYWLVPHLPFSRFAEKAVGATPFFLKPPFAIWLQAISMDVFGVSMAAARLPAVIATLSLVVLIYFLGKGIYDRDTGLFAALIFLTLPMIYGSHGGRSATLDLPMLLFGTVGVYLVFRTVRHQQSNHFLLAGVAFGLALLTKGFGAGIFAIIIAPLILLYPRQFLTRNAIIGAVLSLAIPLMWILSASVVYPNIITIMFNEQVIARVSGASETTPGTFSFMKYPYFRTFPEFYDPWAFLFLPSVLCVPLGIYRRKKAQLLSPTLFLIWWALAVFGFFVLTGNHSWYTMPMAVPLALLCGRLIQCGLYRISAETVGLAVGIVGAVLFSDNFDALLGALTDQATISPMVIRGTLATVGAVGVFGVATLKERSSTIIDESSIQTFAIVLKAALVLALVGFVMLQPVLSTSTSQYGQEQKQLGQALNERTTPDESLYLHPSVTSTPMYTVTFFAQRTLEPASVGKINADTQIEYVFIRQRDISEINRPHRRIGVIQHPSFRSVVVLAMKDT